MDNGHQERPDTRLERYLVIAFLIAILLGGDRLVLRIWNGLGRPHAPEFVGLACLLALAVYLGVVLWYLITVRYTMAGGVLELRQGVRRVAIDLTGQIHLHRWRSRWAWSDGASRDLGVEAIDFFPPWWLLRSSGVWVVTGRTVEGTRRAAALRPSPWLLALLREQVAERRGAGD